MILKKIIHKKNNPDISIKNEFEIGFILQKLNLYLVHRYITF